MKSAIIRLPLDDEIPFFCWDRKWTVAEIRRRLKESQGRERDRLMAWILREASYDEVWQYVTPREIDEALPRIESQLGRWRGMWRHLIKAWHELGKL